MSKIGRNSPCPCGRGEKYKRCCEPKGEKFDERNDDEWIRKLSVRGKNMLFTEIIADALQLDSWHMQPNSFQEFIKLLKRSVTADAVKKIHLAIPKIWPDSEDLDRCLAEESNNNSGLFIGSYLFDSTVSFLNRHALYDQSFILVDPFHDPRVIAPEYNPVDNPAEHITTTFHYILVWLQLIPWIEQGIVKIIRDPGDFNYSLRKETWSASQERGNIPELRSELEKSEKPDEMHDFFQDQLLASPDEYVIKDLKSDDFTEDQIKKFLKKRREESLYFVNSKEKSQILAWSTGTNYEMGKYICEKTNSHIITDLSYRWKEMEYDRRVNNIELSSWSPFAKAFSNVDMRHLQGLTFDDLLKLRNDGYLDDMRRTWNSSSSGNDFDLNRVEDLSAEFTHHIREAEMEWNKIDSGLVKWFGSESILGATIGVGLGTASWLPAAAVAAAGAVNLVQSRNQRKNFINRYPAGFLIDKVRKNA
mgnify:CR=1 FL=1|jgi:hypothetical protein